MRFFFFFFFQAEDGIRDVAVTGVQTCALPISRGVAARAARQASSRSLPHDDRAGHQLAVDGAVVLVRAGRSEERRVGKECRYRMAGGDSKKKAQDINE